MENALIVILIALVAYTLYDQQQPRQKRRKKQKEYVPYPVQVPNIYPGVPTPPYRPPMERMFSQIGILTDPTGGINDILPLYGRLAPGCSTRYQYFTRTSGYQAVQVQVHYGGRNCMDGYCSSCDEIYDGVTGITVDGYSGVTFTASIYQIP